MPTNPAATRQPSFDRIARAYRTLEYLTLGRALERCRFHFLPQLHTHAPQQVLALGDGDGRFLARLLNENPQAQADAVDTSLAMLRLLRKQCEANGAPAIQLHTYHTDALTFAESPTLHPYDLVVTHFFLDCLTQPQLDLFAARLAPRLAPNALWLVSDFRIPTGPLAWPAQLFVRFLYLAFRILTGLRVTSLPNHNAALTRAGLVRIDQQLSCAGLLTTELWSSRPEGTLRAACPSPITGSRPQ